MTSGKTYGGSKLGPVGVASARESVRKAAVTPAQEGRIRFTEGNYGVNDPGNIREAKGYDKLSGNGTNIYKPGARKFTSGFQKQ